MNVFYWNLPQKYRQFEADQVGNQNHWPRSLSRREQVTQIQQPVLPFFEISKSVVVRFEKPAGSYQHVFLDFCVPLLFLKNRSQKKFQQF